MANNQYDMNLTRYTHRDYESIKNDLIDAIPSLTQEWTSTDDSDPGIVLVKLMAMFGDTLSYNIDKIALEMYLQTVTQRKNCAKILELLGYKMHWYRSAKVIAQVKFATGSGTLNNNVMVIRPYDTVFSAGDIDYSYVDTDYGDLSISMSGGSASPSVGVKLVQGTPTSETFTDSALINNRYYLKTNNVDESHLYLLIGTSSSDSDITPNNALKATLIDNIYLAPGGSHVYYSFNVDEYNQPYIQLSENWRSVVTSPTSVRFNLNYLISRGANGNISDDAFTGIRNVYSSASFPTYNNLLVNNFANNSGNYVSTFNSSGKDPQTIEDAKRDAANYVFTHDTLVTPSDYEKAAKRLEDITVSKLVDAQVIINDNLDLDGIVHRCDDNFETVTIDEEEYLKAYIAILYLAYKDFDSDQNHYYIDRSSSYALDIDDPYGADYQGTALENLGFYPYLISDSLQTAERELLQNLHILNVEIDFGTVKLFPFKVKGILNLVEPLSPQDTLQIVNNVNEALRQAYYPELHPVGDKPNFLELVDIIQNADKRIRYFDAIGNIVEWAPLINVDNPSDDNYIDKVFDTTSAIMYNGLSDEFILNDKYMTFTFKNVDIQPDIETLNAYIDPQSEGQVTLPETYDGTAYLYNYYIAQNGHLPSGADDPFLIKVSVYKTVVVTCNTIAELEALCKDLTYSGYITFADSSSLLINNTGLQYVRG